MVIFLLQAGGSSSIVGMLPLLAMIVVFWLFFIRPQQKKQKSQTNFISNEITKGDEVATASGIIGKISKIEDNIVTLQVDTKTFIRVTKGAISKEMTEALNATEE